MSVDICIATYNGAPYLHDQITSVLSQVPFDARVLVSDDGSNDGTLDILSSINDPRLVILEGPKLGVIKNFEFLMQTSKAEYIFLCDQDDVWLEGRFDALMSNLSESDLVVGNGLIAAEDLSSLGISIFEWRNSGRGLVKNILKNSYVGCCMAFNRKVLNLALPLPICVPMHDQWIGVVAELGGFRVSFDENKAFLYRRHSFNQTSLTSLLSVWGRLVNRFGLCVALSSRFVARVKQPRV